jgi:hypothetical protein
MPPAPSIPGRQPQQVYQAFQGNGVWILGLCTMRVIPHEGLPPTVRIQVRLEQGRPVMTDASTLPEGERLPPADSLLTIDLTQANNSIGGYAWYASGTIDNFNTGLSTATAASISSTNWGPYALNDPDNRDRWNNLLPRRVTAASDSLRHKRPACATCRRRRAHGRCRRWGRLRH